MGMGAGWGGGFSGGGGDIGSGLSGDVYGGGFGGGGWGLDLGYGPTGVDAFADMDFTSIDLGSLLEAAPWSSPDLDGMDAMALFQTALEDQGYTTHDMEHIGNGVYIFGNNPKAGVVTPARPYPGRWGSYIKDGEVISASIRGIKQGRDYSGTWAFDTKTKKGTWLGTGNIFRAGPEGLLNPIEVKGPEGYWAGDRWPGLEYTVFTDWISTDNYLQRQANKTALGVNLTDAEYRVIYGVNAPEEIRKLKAVEKLAENDATLLELYEIGDITLEEFQDWQNVWKLPTEGEPRPFTPEEMKTIRADAIKEANLVLPDDIQIVDEGEISDNTIRVIDVLKDKSQYVVPFLPALKAIDKYLVKPAASFISAGRWLKDADIETQAAWEHFNQPSITGVSERVTQEDIELVNPKTLGVTSKEAANILRKNMVAQYQRNLSVWEQIAWETLVLAPSMLTPVGQVGKVGQVPKILAKELNLAQKELKVAEQVLKRAPKQGFKTTAPEMVRISKAQQRVRDAKSGVQNAVTKVEDVAKMAMLKRESQAAATDVMKENTIIEKLLTKQAKLVKTGKKLTPDDAKKLRVARRGLRDASQRLGAAEILRGIEANPVTQKAVLADLPSFENALKQIETSDIWRSISKALAQSKGTNKVQKLVLPSSKTTEGLAQKISYTAQIQMGRARSLATVETAEVLAKESPFLFTEGANGYREIINVKWIGKGKPAINHELDVLEHADDFRLISGVSAGKLVSQDPQVMAMRRILDARLEMLRKAGLDPTLIEMPKGRYYFPRNVRTGSLEYNPSVGVTKKFGKGQFEHRYHSDIAAHPEIYVDNYLTTFTKTVEGSYQIVVEKQVIDFIRQSGLGKEVIDSALKAKLANVQEKIATAEGKGLKAAEIELERLQKQADKALNFSKGKVKGAAELEDLKFSPEEAKELSTIFKASKLDPTLKGIAAVNQTLRFLMTGYDLGAPWIHGQILLFDNPAVWGKALINANIKAIANPKWLSGYINANKEAITSSITRGGMIYDVPEFMEGAAILSKIPLLGKTTKPFERAFTGFLDVARIEQWKALYRPGMSDIEAFSVGAHVDKMLGATSGSRLGMTPTQSTLETIIGFAPRYYRSQLGLIADIARGKLPAKQAVRALASHIAGLHLAYYGIAKSIEPWTGEPPHVIPSDPKYLMFRVGDSYVGPGSFMPSLYKYMARLSTAVYEGDINRVPEVTWRYARGKLSKVMQLSVDAVYGETYIGESVLNIGDFAKEEAQNSLPFWMSAWYDEFPEDTTWERMSRSLFEFMGWRAYHELPWQKVDRIQDELAMRYHGVDYKTLQGKSVEDAMRINAMPEVKAAYDAQEAYKFTQGPGRFNHEKDFLEYSPKRNSLWSAYNDEMNVTSDLYVRGLIEPVIFRERMRQHGEDYGRGIDELDIKYPELSKILNEPREVADDAHTLYRAYRTYMDYVVHSPELTRADLIVEEYAKQKAKMDADFIEQWGQQAYDEVQNLKVIAQDLHPVAGQFKLDKDVLSKGYWTLPYGTPGAAQDRLQYRTDNPQEDAMLFVWGYTKTLQTQDAANMAKNMLWDLEIDKIVPKSINTITQSREYTQINADIDRLYQSIPRNTPRDVHTMELRSTRKNLMNTINADSFALRLITSEDVEKDTILRMNENIDKYDQLTNLVRTYAETHSDPWLELLLSEIQRDLLTLEYRKNQIR